MAGTSYQERESGAETGNSGDEKLLAEARARFKLAQDAERENRDLAEDDQRFRKGEQWPEELRASRELDGRPCLTINRMPQFEQQVTNDQRQNRPSIKVHPVDDKADPETAKVLQGIIKHIEVASSADTARDTAFENAVRGGFGYYRIVTEYESPDSFVQDIRCKRIRDPFTVLLDPNHQEPDGSDADWGFIFERVAKDRFIREYGESKLAGKSADWDLEHQTAPDWVESESVLVAEYFHKEYESVDIVLLTNGATVEKSKLEEYVAQYVPESGAEPLDIVKERKAQVPRVKWCKLNGVEVLDRTDWPGRWIPILPVYGAEIVVEGKLIRESLIRHAKDPARMYNFWKSCETEAITLAPKAPFIGYAGQFEGYEHLWRDANRRNHAYLEVNPVMINGQPAPLPQRSNAEPPVQAITQASMLASDEVKATLGIFDASLGARSNETSGVAIQRRNQQAQTSNFHFTDNLNRTIRHEARIYVDLIPHVYDTARIARIIGEDGEQKLVKVNQEFQDDSGQTVLHDLTVGKYDVTVDTGPSYATRRQEAAATMMEFAKALPGAAQVTADLIAKNMDWPGAQELSERLKKTLPPGMLDDQKNKAIPPEVQAQMQQMGQLIEQLTGQVRGLTDERELKVIEIESKERMKMAELETQLEIKRAELDAKDAIALLNAQIAEINQRQALLRSSEPVEADAAPAPSMPQDTAPPADGAMEAPVGEGMQTPAGGAAPEQEPPMEGMS